MFFATENYVALYVNSCGNMEESDTICICREDKYQPEKMTWDPHCYECKVRYRDPKPKDLVMYLHAWRYKVTILHDRGNTSILIYAIMEREAAKQYDFFTC